ncbi:PD-(D/E)XK nuclease family protein [uncultured Oscillibacter sp.]|uniref:PD-(D/E)XK nuclease family protein n=3 Tax=uncultured Oscillibacter sp. TaxID=876091 RepID=UPI0025D19D17|nr:PD-(D/E)XK nuclease family protein [uncultured Oscillibacter sp.]
MLTLLTGRARTGKSTAVLSRIAARSGGRDQILLVPEHASHQAEVDLCRTCGDSASRFAEVLSFRRLSDRVLSITGGAAQVTLDAGGKLLTLEKALLEVLPELTVYRRPSRKSAFLRQLLDLFDELRCYEVSPETLYEQSQAIAGATHDKLRDLSLLYAAYEARLLRPGLDARDYMTKLCDSLEESGYALNKDVCIDGFTYFTAQERRCLSILLCQAHSLTVTLLGEPDSKEEMFEASLRTLDRLRRLAEREGKPVRVETLTARDPSALGHLERHFFGESLPYQGDAPQIRLLQADTVLSEVEQTAAAIRRLLWEGKCRCREITVAARNMEAYESVIETVFERWQIPAYLSRRSDILEKPALSLLTGALAAVGGGYEYDDMFRWLKTGLAGLAPEECDELENYVLKWEVHGGMWLRDVDWAENPDGYGAPWTQAREARLAKVNALRRRVQGPLSRLAEGLKTGGTAAAKVGALYDFMEELRLQDALETQMKAQAQAGRLQEAEETAQLWEILCGVLDQFVEIVGEEPMELEEFTRLLRQVLTQYSVGTIPVSLDQVQVSGVARNDRHTAKYLFLLGANDHVLPTPGQGGGILGEDDRAELARRGVELAPTGMDQMGIELQNLYAALAQPTQGLTVSWPAADVSGAELRPAFVVDRLLSLFPALRVEREPAAKPYRLTAPLPALESAVPGGALWRRLEAVPAFRPRLEAMARAAHQTRGSLSPGAVRALYGKSAGMTASRLERIRTCHFSYFMEYGLKARPRTPAAFDAPQIGTFLHFLLERVTRDVQALGGFAQVDQDALHALIRKYIEEYVEKELRNFQNRNARFRYLFARLRTTAYAVMDQAAEELRRSDFVPLAFELSFGDGPESDIPAVVISEPDGELRIGGKVDRVDGWLKDGKLYLRVVDYKSGKKAFDLAAVRMGLDIQMLLYLFTLQKAGPSYFGREIEPAGVLYLPARDDILSARRNIPPEKLQAEREKQLRRSGLLLAEPQVLQAMEHEALTEPRYLPLRVNKSGDLSGSLASAAQLGKLGRYVDKLLRDIAGEIRGGVIDADPCCHTEEDSPCRYCDWAPACHFQDGRDGDRLHYILPVKPGEFWQEIEGIEGKEAD